MDWNVVIGEGDVVTDLHLVKQPIRIALQYLCKVHPDIPRWLSKTVHDPAKGSFMNAQHPRQTILSDARGVHPQLEVGVYVSIQCHSCALGFYSDAAFLWGTEEAVTTGDICNPHAKSDV
jgi:hypothetical protein